MIDPDQIEIRKNKILNRNIEIIASIHVNASYNINEYLDNQNLNNEHLEELIRDKLKHSLWNRIYDVNDFYIKIDKIKAMVGLHADPYQILLKLEELSHHLDMPMAKEIPKIKDQPF
jgi:hypothetical protein